MDRVSRFINNKKQDKIRVVNSQPSIQSMREGEEVLFLLKMENFLGIEKNVVSYGDQIWLKQDKR